jgi:hypothetical protein
VLDRNTYLRRRDGASLRIAKSISPTLSCHQGSAKEEPIKPLLFGAAFLPLGIYRQFIFRSVSDSDVLFPMPFR